MLSGIEWNFWAVRRPFFLQSCLRLVFTSVSVWFFSLFPSGGGGGGGETAEASANPFGGGSPAHPPPRPPPPAGPAPLGDLLAGGGDAGQAFQTFDFLSGAAAPPSAVASAADEAAPASASPRKQAGNGRARRKPSKAASTILNPILSSS